MMVARREILNTEQVRVPELAMKERDVVAHVKELAQRFGWKLYCAPMPVRPIAGNKFVPEKDGTGFPDFLLLRGSRMVVLECKGPKGRLRGPQREWLDAFQEFMDVVDIASMVTAEQGGAEDDLPRVDVLVVRPEGLEELAEVLR